MDNYKNIEKDCATDHKSKIDYDDEPVHYCKRCMSLSIRTMDNSDALLDYCDDCGSTDVAVAGNIQEYAAILSVEKGESLIVSKIV